MPFDYERAAQARKENPALTVFDTGEKLEPIPWTKPGTSEKTGAVDFDNDESTTELTVTAYPSRWADALVLGVDSAMDRALLIYVNGNLVATIPPQEKP